MGNTTIIIIVTALVLIGAITFGLVMSFKDKKSGNWIVGGRKLPIYVIAGTQFATIGMGGSVLVASVGIGYSDGWSALTYNALAGIAVFILAIFASWLHKQNFNSMPDIIKKLYGENKILMILVTLLVIVVPFGWLCSQLMAFASIFSEITGVSSTVLVIAFAILSLGLVIPGGLQTVAWTDFLFGCVMLIMSITSVVYVIYVAGGVTEIVSNVPQSNSNFPKGLGAAGIATSLLWIFSILPGNMTNQMSFQRIFASDSAKSARTAFIIAGLLSFFVGAWAAIMGMSIYSINPNLSDPESASGWFLGEIPFGFLALYSAFIVATIMSTLTSSTQSVVVNLTKDIYQGYISPNASNKKIVSLSRLLSVIVMMIAVIIAILFPGVLAMMEATYAYSAAGLLVPIFGGMILKKTNFITIQGAFASLILGVTSAAIAHIINTDIPYSVYGIIGSLIGFILFNYIYRNRFQSHTFDTTVKGTN